MKILYLADANSVHTKKFCKFFNQRGHETVVISLGHGSIENTKVYDMGIDEFDKVSSAKKFINYFSKYRNFRNIIKKEKPDVIHAHYASSYGMIARLVDIHPYILSVWGSDVYDFPKTSLIHKSLLEGNLKNADVILSTSKAMKEETKKYTDKEIIVTPFGVDTNKFKPIETEKISDFTVGTVKSLYSIYGIEYLIEGFAKFIKKSRCTNCRLIIGGKGPEKEKLIKLVNSLNISDKIDFLGYLSEDKVVEAYNKMDVAIFSSVVEESFGVSVIEAEACEVATVVTNVGGLPEVVSPNSPFIIKTQDSDEITTVLCNLYLNPDSRVIYAKEARKYVLDNYDINDNFSKIEKIYKDLMTKKRA